MRTWLLGLLLYILLTGCSTNIREVPLFNDVTHQTGIRFINELNYTPELNPYTYRNFFNGAGVAIGDINNDGLLDVFFTGNQVENKLYLNQGNLQFKDITIEAGVASDGAWSTGVTMVDINADGFLDIYVCKSGPPVTSKRHNELFINNGDLTFTERSAEFGLDIIGLSVQAAFFDYDRDGDLDCYLLTNSFKSVGNFDLIEGRRNIPDQENGGNKFFINNNGKYEDYTEQAGIYRSDIGFGLGITLGDFNDDLWVDIFISNDFFERDYLYINNTNGGFIEALPEYFESISAGSMGADFADLDGDGLNELFVTEMLPDSLARRKSKIHFDSWDKYKEAVNNGYHFQFIRNTLQKKSIDGNYKELGRLAGLAASEWSWGALLFDADNDGLRDVFIANGIYKDLLDRDYLSYSGNYEVMRELLKDRENGIIKLIESMPRSHFSNYAFHNEGNFKFRNVSNLWGFNTHMYSSGAAYGDLDNDGDLDLILSNINAPAIVYRNNTDTATFKSVRFIFTSKTLNVNMVGTSLYAYAGGRLISGDNYTVRGYQSSVQPWITLGLGKLVLIDSAIIVWPDGSQTVSYNLNANRNYVVEYESEKRFLKSVKAEKLSSSFCIQKIDSTTKHAGSGFSDFNRDRLLPFMYSNEMPSLMKADIDGDGIDEIYLGGGKDQAGTLITFDNGRIMKSKPFERNVFGLPEETQGSFFDADGDGDLDYYFATGGRFFPLISSAQTDRLMINTGADKFQESDIPLPIPNIATSFVKAFDFDKDGDQDLIVAVRFDPFNYGYGGRAYLLQNDGRGRFADVTIKYAPDLINAGMITDGVIVDYDGDGWDDLVMVGDWMAVTALKNNVGYFINDSSKLTFNDTEGWWNTIETADLNQDGYPDFVLGNHGLNSFFKPGDRMYVNDFDSNGSVEHIFCTEINDKYYPILDKDELLSQIPSLKKSLIYYKDYKDKSMDQIFGSTVLVESTKFETRILASIFIISSPAGYKIFELPQQAQYSPVYAILLQDLDNDGVLDMITGGNQYQVKPQFGRYDASDCFFFKGRLVDNTFKFDEGRSLGIKGQVRDIQYIECKNEKLILFAKHDDNLEIFKLCN
ncbi:MAG: VCBS repeat-containing protein [Cyclobacteriaceae bacterium]|nr:VCBS repeat-containing protein [Cyclobacteriaceae bacterium]